MNFEMNDALLKKVRSRFKLEKTESDRKIKLNVNIDEIIHGDYIDHYEIEYKGVDGDKFIISDVEMIDEDIILPR